MTLRAINHKLRQQIVRLLDEHKRMNVTDIYVKLRLEQSVASQHLAILRRADIVTTERDGKFIHYGLNHDRIAAIGQFVSELVLSGNEAASHKKTKAPKAEVETEAANHSENNSHSTANHNHQDEAPKHEPEMSHNNSEMSNN